MKKILFYSENYCGSNAKGGTEVATYRIANALKATGEFEIFHAYRSKAIQEEKSIYSDVIKLSRSGGLFKKSLAIFLRNHEIDYIVNMSRFFRHEDIKKAAKRSGRNIKIIFMQHFAPGSEIKKPTYKSGFHLLKLNPLNPSYWIRSTVYPLIKLPRNLRLSKIYKKTYDISDQIVLLSEGYKEDYKAFGELSNESKFTIIPNIYEPDENIKISDFKKEKRVLILSRIDEIQKRISLALQIWKKIEEDPDLYDWHLDIVGKGHNVDIVKRLIKKYKLERVTYHGWQKRESYLKDSSILMMTSEYEGLPLSILEAQAYGCVPIAYNSFASLKDVIEPFSNGVIVEKYGDISEYVKKLTELMYDKAYREELSSNASRLSEKFSSENIAHKWLKILT